MSEALDFYTERIFFKNLYHYDNNYIVKPKEYGDLLLYQAGEMAAASDTVIEEHIHRDWFELTYILDGCGTVYANGIPTYMQKGDVYISLPGERHRIEADPIEPCRFFFCSFYCTENSKLAEIIEEARLRELNETQRCYNILSLSDIFRGVLGEVRSDDAISSYLFECGLKSGILKIIRRVMEEGEVRYSSPKLGRSDLICYNIMNYIDTHLTRIKKLSELGEIFGYNYSHMSRKFRVNMGMTITDYYEQRRIDKAKELFEGGMNVTAVAEALNYSSVYVFSRSFKRYAEMSAAEYKKQVSGAEKTKNSK